MSINFIPTLSTWAHLAAYGKIVINDAEGDCGLPTSLFQWDGLEPNTDYTAEIDIESNTYNTTLILYAGNHSTGKTASPTGATTVTFNTGSGTNVRLVPSQAGANMTIKSVSLTPAQAS
jgi:hypothetical protein